MTARLPVGDRVELPAEPESVAAARAAMGRLAEAVGAPVDDVKLTVSEAVGNAVVHAFRDRPQGTVVVEGRLDGEWLVVTVVDNGMGMTPNPNSSGLGFGLALITRLASGVRFDASDAGTAVTMRYPARPEVAPL